MANQSFAKSVMKKTALGVIIGVLLVVGAQLTHFPFVFQVMFFIYAMLGALVFILLEAPAMPRLEGVKAIGALLVFYFILSGLYIAGASLLPQFDPDDEKGKIEKVLKLRRAQTELGKADELIARAKELDERAQAISNQLSSLGVGAQVEMAEQPSSDGAGAATGDVVALGKEQWELQECYNCHKLYGQGGKKRGPEMDNIGNLMSPAQLKEKIIDPKSWKAEGFDKDFNKGKMPDKYKDLMFPKEIDALVAFLASLKDASVKTPKPIKMN
jgi:disulfide bond formation protein DsbB